MHTGKEETLSLSVFYLTFKTHYTLHFIPSRRPTRFTLTPAWPTGPVRFSLSPVPPIILTRLALSLIPPVGHSYLQAPLASLYLILPPDPARSALSFSFHLQTLGLPKPLTSPIMPTFSLPHYDHLMHSIPTSFDSRTTSCYRPQAHQLSSVRQHDLRTASKDKGSGHLCRAIAG